MPYLRTSQHEKTGAWSRSSRLVPKYGAAWTWNLDRNNKRLAMSSSTVSPERIGIRGRRRRALGLSALVRSAPRMSQERGGFQFSRERRRGDLLHRKRHRSARSGSTAFPGHSPRGTTSSRLASVLAGSFQLKHRPHHFTDRNSNESTDGRYHVSRSGARFRRHR